jgi:D-alanyl-D-alanine carboxypeptidase (penicillin-binding protein 5/6)
VSPLAPRRRRELLLATLATLLILVALLAPGARAASAPPSLSARSAIVMEVSTHDVPYARAPDRERPIASTTKLMTALLVLERVPLTKTFTASRYRPAPVESQIGLRPGERMQVADLMRGLLLASGNDAAMTLAEGVAGSRRAFVRLMNRRARQLHLEHTHYANPIGLDERGNYSSARDLARLTLRLRRFAFFRRWVNREEATLATGDHPRTIHNRNLLLGQVKWVSGVKTGHTQRAGWVLVGSGTPKRGVTLVSVVLGAPSEAARDEDTLALLRWAAGRYRRIMKIERGNVYASVPIRYRRGAQVDLVATRSVSLVARRAQRVAVRLVDVPDSVSGPLRKGEKVARIEVRVNGRRVESVPLVSAASVPRAGLTQVAKEWFTRPVVYVLLLALVGGGVALAIRRRGGRGSGRPRPISRAEVT